MAEKKITISFRKSPDYKMYPATGCWGGATSDGHVLMNIFVEHGALPVVQSFEVSEEGVYNRKQPVDTVSSGDVERDVLCGILLSPHTARSVAEWLIRHADTIEGKK